jgi:phosphoribosylformylglycinamidine (FGAM) synthase-like enzyme
MRAWEILLSESQERMLVVVKKGREAEVKAIFDKWDLNCVEIGTVTEGGPALLHGTENLVAEVPAESLVLGGGAPVSTPATNASPPTSRRTRSSRPPEVPEPDDLKAVAFDLLASPNIASKRWV